jgi:branched-chain amino acid transport system substrate-binding protein
MGPDGLDSPTLVDGYPNLAGRTFYTTAAAPIGRWGPASSFAADYQRTFGQAPPPYSAESYDAAGICIEAIIRAVARGNTKPTRSDVVQAMNNLSRVGGIAGPYSFNREGDPQTAVYFVLRVTATRPEEWNNNPLIAEVHEGPP